MRLRKQALTEDGFMEQVAAAAKVLGWRRAHFRPLRTKDGWRTACQFEAKGFPDLVLVRGNRLVFAELKRTAKDRPTAEQAAWLESLRQTGRVEVYLWTADSWAEIERVLA